MVGTLKRTYHVTKDTVPKKRQRTQDAAVRRSLGRLGMKPELKYTDTLFDIAQVNNLAIATTDITNVQQGTGDGFRIGEEIRVKRIEFTGQLMGDSGQMKFFLIRPAPGVATPPQFSYFTGTIGNRLIQSQGWEVHSISRGNMTGVASIVDKNHPDYAKNFNPPMRVRFNLTGTCLENHLWACFVNNSGINATSVKGVVRMYYYDA